MTFSENNAHLSQMTALFLTNTLTLTLMLLFNLFVLIDPNKAYGCDGISICMLKLYATSISKPLHILFNNLVMNGKKQILSQFIKKVTNK